MYCPKHAMISNLHCITWWVIWKFQKWRHDVIVIDILFILRLSYLKSNLHFEISINDVIA